MAVNMDRPDRWEADIAASVVAFDGWFESFATDAVREARSEVVNEVPDLFDASANLTALDWNLLRAEPRRLRALRMVTAPPLAQDRLAGFAKISKSLVDNMEERERLPPRMDDEEIEAKLNDIITVVRRRLDSHIFPWIGESGHASERELVAAKAVVEDRLALSIANPRIRNAQEERQLSVLAGALAELGYRDLSGAPGASFVGLPPGTFARHVGVQGKQTGGNRVNVPVDVMIRRKPDLRTASVPVLVEAKSAGDFTNVNKRRKEEADKVANLRRVHGESVQFVLLLGGYFDIGYLQYVANERIDWIWEHRISDLAELGL